MHGVGSATAAVTFVNALFTGVGAAAAIDLTLTAEVDLEPATGDSPAVRVSEPGSDTPLVRASLADALRRWGHGGRYQGSLELRSEIPPSKGLKSSSAVGVAIGRAVARAFGVPASPWALALASSEVSQRIGLSATGAFDDALAAAGGGVVVTENSGPTVRYRGALPTEWSVVAWVPLGVHAPSVDWRSNFRARAAEAEPAVEAALRHDWAAAMEANTRLVESILKYEVGDLRLALGAAGAIASGVSGLGPALAVICPGARTSELTRLLPEGETWSTRFVPPASPEAGVP
ncbi:MAG: shikimate kinase [Thermoplasmata archaeon]|nr:shikimate kinase [Thermoplasmata archaeon]